MDTFCIGFVVFQPYIIQTKRKISTLGRRLFLSYIGLEEIALWKKHGLCRKCPLFTTTKGPFTIDIDQFWAISDYPTSP